MRALDRALKRLGMRRRAAAPATAVDLEVNRRGRRHWTAGVSVVPLEPAIAVEVSGVRASIDGAYRVVLASPSGEVLELEPVEDVTVSCDRPLSDYAQPAEPAPPAPPPFDPVRAWADVGLAWLRCAHTVAEIPAQLALYHRVRVVGLH